MKIISFDQAFQDITKEVTKIPRKEYLSHGQFPIVDQGDGEIAGYTNCGKGLYTEVPVVLFGDHTRVFKYINFPFFAGADGTKILKAKFGTDAHFGYYSFMQYPLISLGYSRHFKLLKERMFHTFDYATQLRIAAIIFNTRSEGCRADIVRIAHRSSISVKRFSISSTVGIMPLTVFGANLDNSYSKLETGCFQFPDGIA